MRAITIQEFGDASGMRLSDIPSPLPTGSQVLIETEAIAVAGVDAVIRRNTLGTNFPPGMIPGSEVAGKIVSVASGVDPVWIGKKVWAFTGLNGGYAEQSLAQVDDLTLLPKDLSPIDAVALGSAGTVAHFALEHAHFRSGENVLVRGAAGSIGIAVVELAVRGGAGAVAVTTSSPERGTRLLELGATRILDREGVDDSGAQTGFDVIIDIVGGHHMPQFLDRLAPNGRLALVGAVAGYPPVDFGRSLLEAFQQSRSFSTFSLSTISTAEQNEVREELFAQIKRGEITPVVDAILPLEKAAEAHHRMDNGSVFGRIVLVP